MPFFTLKKTCLYFLKKLTFLLSKSMKYNKTTEIISYLFLTHKSSQSIRKVNKPRDVISK